MEEGNEESLSKNRPSPSLPMISLRATKLAVLKLLGEKGNAHSIAKQLRKGRSSVVEHLQSLERLGLAKKGELGEYGEVWMITEQGKAYLGGRFSLVPYERRGVGVTSQLYKDTPENIKIKFPVTGFPTPEVLISCGWGHYALKHHVQYTKRAGEYFTTYTGKSLIVQLPPFKEGQHDPDLALAEAGRLALELKDKYEKEVPGLKLGDYDVVGQLISQEHVINGHPFAELLTKNNISYQGPISKVDASKGKANGIAALEFPDPTQSHIHVKAAMDFTEDYATKETLKASELTEIIRKLVPIVRDTVELTKETAAGQLNITKFLEAQIPKKVEQTTKPQIKIKKEDIPSYFG